MSCRCAVQERLICTAVGQRLASLRFVAQTNNRRDLWSTRAARVETYSPEPIIEDVVYEVMLSWNFISRSGTSFNCLVNFLLQDGIFRVSGLLYSELPQKDIYNVLTDYSSLPRVFHNVEQCSVSVSEDGRKFVTQMMLWNFLIFRGSFETELEVLENIKNFEISFSLIQSAFMNQFVGEWRIEQDASGISTVRHSISVVPSVRPPQKIGDLTKKIFEAQVEKILRDLRKELENIGCLPN